MSMVRTLALVRDVAPVVGVMVLALFVLWQGAERRRSAEVESDHGGASRVQSGALSDEGVPWRLAEPGEPQQQTERPTVRAELALPAGLGVSAVAVVFFVAYPRVRRRARQWRS